MVRPRLLIVDEQSHVRTALQLALRIRGYLCTAVGTLEQALSAFDVFVPDTILIEWAFRNCANRRCDVVKALRKRARERGVTVSIVVLSYLEPPTEAGELEEIDRYLLKPASLSAIEAAILH
jgi:DNA-binding response OmpR family regulator